MELSVTPRAITPHEAEIIDWLLDNAATGDVSPYRTAPATSLQVVGGCDCGCSSLFFQGSETKDPLTMLADAVAVYPDKKQAGLILWGRDHAIVWLEVYEMDPVANRVPGMSDLRRWEDLFRDA